MIITDYNGPVNVHVIGIGGIGVSALAALYHAKGHTVQGSDMESTAMTTQLEEKGIKITIGHDAKNIKYKPDLVVYSLAIPHNNPELVEAKKKGIKTLSYPEALGELTPHYYTIAICGTHGKSTITALVAKMLIDAKFDPTVIVGTKLRELGDSNFRLGKSRILVLEACEYKRAFLNYQPQAIILHTLDPDHMDYYKDFEEYIDAFRSFVRRLPKSGYFFGNLDDKDIHDIFKTLKKEKFPAYNTFTYSTKYEESNFFLNSAHAITHEEKNLGELKLSIPGEHNRTNALAAFSLGATLGIAPKDIFASLRMYKGAFRRFEEKGKLGKTLIIDDYGHHPAEITATLQAAREKFPTKKICVVFQPHQYSRTKNLLKEFAISFKDADEVIIPNIYASRDSEADKKSVPPEMLVKEITKHHAHVHNGEGVDKTISWLTKNAARFDVIMTMGAGDVWKVAQRLTTLAYDSTNSL